MYYTDSEVIANTLRGTGTMSDLEIIEEEIKTFMASEKRKSMQQGISYMAGEHEITNRMRMAIGEGGKLIQVQNAPNNRIVDNQYRRLVVQKTQYFVGNPIVIQSENKEYEKLLRKLFSRKFLKLLNRICENSLNCGIGWLYAYIDAGGKIKFKSFESQDCIPIWKDKEHEELEKFIRMYHVDTYEGRQLKKIEKVEVYTKVGIDRYVLKNGKLEPDVDSPGGVYFGEIDEFGETSTFPWTKIPIIGFKYGLAEQPLIKRVKCLQDALNLIWSIYMNENEEDSGNTILIIENYDGEDLGEFRRNLAAYRAVKVSTAEGARGNVRSLKIELNPENYKTIMSLLKKAIIENGMGYDAKDDKLGGNPNEMNLKSMYSDIDLDTNMIEMEFQSSLELLCEVICEYFSFMRKGDFATEIATFTFTRDVMMSTAESIQNVVTSIGATSRETALAKHPWVSDVAVELERLKKEQDADAEIYGLEVDKTE